MGNKQQLAGKVATFCESLAPEPRLVDLFGGMGSVAGAAAASRRRVLVNDVQHYAQLATRCLITSREEPPDVDAMRCLLLPAYRRNLKSLQQRYADALREERRILGAGDVS